MNPNGSQTYSSKIDRLIAEHEDMLVALKRNTIAEHEKILAALKLTRAVLDGEARKKKQKTNGALTEALATEARRHGPSKKKHPYGHGVIAAQRARSEEFLAHFDRHKPTQPPSNGDGNPIMRTALGPMVRRGYLAKKGGGYVRTAKPYIVNPSHAWNHKAPTKGHPTELQRRQVSADFLAQFDTETPKLVSSRLLPSMLKTGYLKHKGDGYIRTGKEFVVNRDARS